MRGLLLFLAISLVPVTASAVTDEQRAQVYREFRVAFDTHDFLTALPLAQKVVSMTEEQYGGGNLALVTPLANLGTTEYRLRDFKTAEQTFQRSVKIGEDAGVTNDRLLLPPLHGLGVTYFASGQYEDASLILKRALDLSRNLDGLFNVAQTPMLDRLIDSFVTLERHEDAERAYEYSIRVAETGFGQADVHVLRPLDRYARWQEVMGRYMTARVLYARALQIAENSAGSGSPRTIDPLLGIARTYRLEFVNKGGTESGGPDPFAAEEDADTTAANAEHLNPEGERAIMLALKAINQARPMDPARRGAALVELGDWFLSGASVTKGLLAYREAWKDLAIAGATASVSAPRQLAYRPPAASLTRTRSDDRDSLQEHFVEASFTVTREGRTADIRLAATDATEAQQKAVLGAIRKARYAPRLENGAPVDTSGVSLRERLVSKKTRNAPTT